MKSTKALWRKYDEFGALAEYHRDIWLSDDPSVSQADRDYHRAMMIRRGTQAQKVFDIILSKIDDAIESNKTKGKK